MKKILLTSLLFTVLAFGFTSCLKDKGFENNEYGINDPDTQPPGVGFPLGANARNDYGLNVSASQQLVEGYVFVNLEAGNAATSDVKVTIVNNTDALVNSYNAANPSANIQKIPSAIISVPTTLTIPAGGRFVQVPITVSNTTGLNPNLAYGYGLQISSADGGYKIADNLKNLFIVFSVKNQYDGIYSITGAALRFGDPVLSGNYGPYERSLVTSGPNSVQWSGQVLWANGSGSALPGGYEPNVTINPGNNLVTSVSSPNSAIYMTSPVIRTDILQGSTQRYDPATKTIYFEFSYGGGPSSRLFSFAARFVRPR